MGRGKRFRPRQTGICEGEGEGKALLGSREQEGAPELLSRRRADARGNPVRAHPTLAFTVRAGK